MDKQSDDVMTAILEGKYSWACVLWLREKGYNPKEYIPCRTYNRLLRQQQTGYKRGDNTTLKSQNHRHRPKIVDLSHLESSHHSSRSVQGGFQPRRIRSRFCIPRLGIKSR